MTGALERYMRATVRSDADWIQRAFMAGDPDTASRSVEDVLTDEDRERIDDQRTDEEALEDAVDELEERLVD